MLGNRVTQFDVTETVGREKLKEASGCDAPPPPVCSRVTSLCVYHTA